MRTVGDVARMFFDSRIERGNRQATVVNYRSFIAWLVRRYGPWEIASLSRDELRGFLRTYGPSRASNVRCVLRWAWQEGLVPSDAMRGMIFQKRRGEINYLPSDDAWAFFNAVSAPYRAAFALGLFAGLRPYEVARAKWGQIRFGSEPCILVPAETSKTGRRRIIQPEERQMLRVPWLEIEIELGRKPGIPALAWRLLEPLAGAPNDYVLPPCRQEHRDIMSVAVPSWIAERLRAGTAARVKLGHNILRHTFLTHLVALSQDYGLAAKAAGHCDLSMLRRHYDGVETRSAGERFFREPARKNSTDMTWTPEMMAMYLAQIEIARLRGDLAPVCASGIHKSIR